MGEISKEDPLNNSTFSYDYTINSKMIEKIKKLFLKKHVYKIKDIISLLNTKKQSSINLESIYNSLTYLIETKNDYVVDKFGRKGNIINIKDLYLFQPVELDSYTSYYDK